MCGVLAHKYIIHFEQMMSGKCSMLSPHPSCFCFLKVVIRGKAGKCGVCLSRENKIAVTKIEVQSFCGLHLGHSYMYYFFMSVFF